MRWAIMRYSELAANVSCMSKSTFMPTIEERASIWKNWTASEISRASIWKNWTASEISFSALSENLTDTLVLLGFDERRVPAPRPMECDWRNLEPNKTRVS